MRHLIIAFLFISTSSLAQTIGNTVFKQHIATLYDNKNNLPDTQVDNILILNNVVLVRYENQYFHQGKNKQWEKVNSNNILTPGKIKQEIAGKKVLSHVLYQGKIHVYGTADGLYFDNGKSIEKIYPSDES